MSTRKVTKVLLLASITAATFLAGCELIVDFDRTKIPVDVNEASVSDANTSETGVPIEAGSEDASTDASDAAITDAGDAGDADAQ